MKTQYCSLLFLLKDDQILLAMKKRGFGSNRYNGVGGKIEPGESEEQALIRECQEEIGVTPTRFKKVAENDFINDTGNDPWRMFVHVYIATEWEGEPVETEEMAPEWFKLPEIPYDNMWVDDIHWVPQILAGKKIKGHFTFDDNEQLLTHKVETVESFND
ncbi:MAG: putative hydrolase [Candidatus Saccharibacteria bacterium]|nr:putative hydrolase [Candidatus Saccharibacteria bacterium]